MDPCPHRAHSWSADWVTVATGAYAIAVLITVALIRWIGEQWWPVTLLVVMPRWLFLPPTVALAWAAGRASRPRLWIVHGAISLVVVGPLMAISLPIGRLAHRDPTGPRVRIMTFNRGTQGIDAGRLIRLIEREGIQLICFQEGGGDPVLRAYWKTGWHRTDFVASRFPVLSVARPLDLGDSPFPAWRTRLECVRVQAAPGLEFVVASVHLDTVRHGLQMLRSGDVDGLRRHNTWRRREAERVVVALTGEPGLPVLVGGDFNMPSDSPLFAPVRRRFRVGFDEAGWGYGYTYLASLPLIRIDHLLASDHWRITRCWVGPDLGSDHRPLIAEVALARGERAPVRAATMALMRLPGHLRAVSWPNATEPQARAQTIDAIDGVAESSTPTAARGPGGRCRGDGPSAARITRRQRRGRQGRVRRPDRRGNRCQRRYGDQRRHGLGGRRRRGPGGRRSADRLDRGDRGQDDLPPRRAGRGPGRQPDRHPWGHDRPRRRRRPWPG
jgi:vancomycin resistance protein VanJ